MGSLPFPLVLRDDAFAPPEGLHTYYVLAANGLFLERHTPLFSVSVPAPSGVPGLHDHAPGLRLRLPRVPAVLVERAVGFFRAVWERWEGEGILLLFYAPSLGRFALGAPPQVLTGRVEHGCFRAEMHLDYLPCPAPAADYLCVGTMHSHGAWAAGHSAIDQHDEEYEAGLHVTVGHVTRPRPSFVASFVVGGSRFPLDPATVLGRFERARRPLDPWFDQIVLRPRDGAAPAAARDGGRR
jgi:hypothetical protein